MRADFRRRDLWVLVGSESFPVRGVSGSSTAEALDDLLRVPRLFLAGEGLSESTGRELDAVGVSKDGPISPRGGGLRASIRRVSWIKLKKPVGGSPDAFGPGDVAASECGCMRPSSSDLTGYTKELLDSLGRSGIDREEHRGGHRLK